MLSEHHISTVYLTFKVKVPLCGRLVVVSGAHAPPLKLDTQKIPLVTLSLALLRATEYFYGWNLK